MNIWTILHKLMGNIEENFKTIDMEEVNGVWIKKENNNG